MSTDYYAWCEGCGVSFYLGARMGSVYTFGHNSRSTEEQQAILQRIADHVDHGGPVRIGYPEDVPELDE